LLKEIHVSRWLLLLLLFFPILAHGQEKLTLTTPAFTGTGADFRFWSLVLRRAHPDGPASIVAIYREVSGTPPMFIATGRAVSCAYADAAAETFIIALNKVNLSTTSLEKRVLQKCQADAKLGAGTISGSPE